MVMPARLGLWTGVLVTPLAALLALGSAGAGHGDYVFAKLLFPAFMLPPLGLLIWLALAQYPLYGWIIDWTRQRKQARRGTAIVAALHLGALAIIVFHPPDGFGSALSYRPEYSVLCETSERFDWIGRRGSWDLALKGVDYRLSVWEEGANRTASRPLERATWIRISGLTLGRAVGWYAPEMLYDPGSAVLIVNGHPVSALPRAWKGGSERSWAPEVEVPVPLNLNAEQFSIGYYIAFPIEPKVGDHYELDLGTALLDNASVRLPKQRSCHCPGKFLWRKPGHPGPTTDEQIC